MTTIEPYKKAILTYLDVLGFGQQVAKSKSPAVILKLLQKTTRKTKASSVVLRSDGTVKSWTTTRNFSDLIVRHTEIAPHHTNLIERLNIEIQLLVQMQCELVAKDGILIRGGMSLRRCYIDGEFLFGEALNEAYRLEHQVAIYPRIVLDKQLVATVEAQTASVWSPSIKRGEDGLYFVNYLYAGYKYANTSGFTRVNVENKADLLSAHKKKIERELSRRRRKLDERARQKWLWAGLYHNGVVERLIAEQETIHETMFLQDYVLR